MSLALAACGPPKLIFPSKTPPAQLTRLAPANATTIRLDTSAFRSKQVDLNFGGLVAQRIFFDQRLDGYTWFGTIGDRGSAIFVVRKNGSITGAINTGKLHFEIGPLGTQHVLTQPDARLPDHAFVTPVSSQPDIVVNTEPVSLWLGKTKIGVSFAYTRAVASKVDDIEGLIQLSVDEANLANLVSKVPIWYQVAGSYVDEYVEDTDFQTVLNHFANAGDGQLEEIHTLRRKKGGDLAILLLDSSGFEKKAAGQSKEINASSETAFAVVDYQAAATLSTVAHEIGHLLGSQHDFQMSPDLKPYPDGHGYRADDWGTIVATRCSVPAICPRLLRWSNKKLGWGDEHANNQNVFTKRRGAVSKFR